MNEEHPTMKAHREFGQVVTKYGPLESVNALLMVLAEVIVSCVEKPQQNKAVKLMEKDIKRNIKLVQERMDLMGRVQ